MKDSLGFQALRPLHVSFVLFWILLASSGAVYMALEEMGGVKINMKQGIMTWMLWICAIILVYIAYSIGSFGGREYWEFPPPIALIILLAWLGFVVVVIQRIKRIKKWPVYIWMWMTGSLFFLFIFIENYLWLLPYFHSDVVQDMTIQWKVNGSIVGAWNQLIYGTSFYLLDRITGGQQVGRSRTAFWMFFLGLFNLMFNWGHHIYTLPTAGYVKYIGYVVSMTEWIFFLRIIYNWKHSLKDFQKHYHRFAYRFIIAAEVWVFINMGQAILMSIPALNLYTHGTHVTVAHAMGTTIGINTMILLAAVFTFSGIDISERSNKLLTPVFYIMQASFLIFWMALITAGIRRGLWQMSAVQGPFSKMMDLLAPLFTVFFAAGIILSLCLMVLIIFLLRMKWRT